MPLFGQAVRSMVIKSILSQRRLACQHISFFVFAKASLPNRSVTVLPDHLLRLASESNVHAWFNPDVSAP